MTEKFSAIGNANIAQTSGKLKKPTTYMEDKIKKLIEEGKNYTFSKCSEYHPLHNDTYSKSSPELLAWAAECEDFIRENYGKDSVPWEMFSGFSRLQLDGNHQDTFDDQIKIIISSLTSCLRIKSKNHNSLRKEDKKVDLSHVFIVHGHDEEAKLRTARFIEKLGLKPIILHEQASSGKTIIEKIENYSNVGFGIVLYTPCDLGTSKLKMDELNARARQNVVFEHGFLIGKIGRENVCALVKGTIEIPNDISGVVYIEMDHNDAWQFQIAKELKKSGYNIDMNRIIN